MNMFQSYLIIITFVVSFCYCNANIDAEGTCPPVPSCPSRCQLRLTGGCPQCTCPEELKPPCPKVSCPRQCQSTTDSNGCPSCECPPAERVCPAIPECPLGCLEQGADCISCNCTVPGKSGPMKEDIDEGLMGTTENVIDEIETTETNIPAEQNPTDGLDEELENPIGSRRPPSYTPSDALRPERRLNKNGENEQQDRLNKNGSNNQQNTEQNNPNPYNIQCGETACSGGCLLCVQATNSCGRCLCGSQSTMCPSLPRCKVSCIANRGDGCYECRCPGDDDVGNRNGVGQGTYGGETAERESTEILSNDLIMRNSNPFPGFRLNLRPSHTGINNIMRSGLLATGMPNPGLRGHSFIRPGLPSRNPTFVIAFQRIPSK